MATSAELPRMQLSQAVPRMLSDVSEFMRRHAMRAMGPPLVRYRVVDYNTGHVAIDTGLPVGAAEVAADRRFRYDTIPAGEYAVVTHEGAYDSLVETTAAILDWAKRTNTQWRMTERDYVTRWDARVEHYQVGPDDDPNPAHWRTEIAILLAR